MFGQKIKNLAHSEDLKSAENYFLLYFQQLWNKNVPKGILGLKKYCVQTVSKNKA